MNQEDLERAKIRYKNEMPWIRAAIKYYKTHSIGIRQVCLKYNIRTWLFSAILKEHRIKNGCLLKCPFCDNGIIKRFGICHQCNGCGFISKENLRQIKYIAKKYRAIL